MGIIKLIGSLIFGIILRAPVYVLPFALFATEYFLKNSLNVEFSVDLLPVAILSAALGLISSTVVLDMPQALLLALSAIQQKALRIISGIAFTFFIVGIPLFAELIIETVKTDKISLLPNLVTDPFGIHMSVQLTWAALFYIVSLILNEIKTGVSS